MRGWRDDSGAPSGSGVREKSRFWRYSRSPIRLAASSLFLETGKPSRDPRVEAAFRVRYKSVDELVIGYSKNLSKGGLFLRTEKFLPVDTRVRLHIELPDGGGEITVDCRVAYIREDVDWGSIGQPPGMGVQFLDPNDEARGRIERFIGDCAIRDAQTPDTPRRPRPVRVLIVDDDVPYCNVAAEPFRVRGDSVCIAHDGIEALAMCLKERPDVILCDVQMPRMDGWQLLRMIRARPALVDVPVIFLTTLKGEEDRLLGYRLGVDDYIEKPYRPAEVVIRADRVMARADSARQANKHPTLRGELEQVSVASVLSFLELEKKTGVLHVDGPRKVSIVLKGGAPIRLEEAPGTAPRSDQKQALFEVLDWRRGQFEFLAQDVSGDDRLRTNVTSLLLEHARVIDESSRG